MSTEKPGDQETFDRRPEGTFVAKYGGKTKHGSLRAFVYDSGDIRITTSDQKSRLVGSVVLDAFEAESLAKTLIEIGSPETGRMLSYEDSPPVSDVQINELVADALEDGNAPDTSDVDLAAEWSGELYEAVDRLRGLIKEYGAARVLQLLREMNTGQPTPPERMDPNLVGPMLKLILKFSPGNVLRAAQTLAANEEQR